MTHAEVAAELLKHVLVLDRLAHPRRVIAEASLGVDKYALPVETVSDLATREYKTFTGDAHHMGGDMFVEVAFACECGHRLEQGPPVVSWARHVSKVTGLPEPTLLRHAIAHLRGTPATASCDCGRPFISLENPEWPAEALERWAAHVVEVA